MIIYIILEIYLLYVTYKRIKDLQQGKKVTCVDNIVALVCWIAACYLGFINFDSQSEIIHIIIVAVICCILPGYMVIQKWKSE